MSELSESDDRAVELGLPEEAPETMVDFLDGETKPSLVIPTSEGWRSESPDVDLGEASVRRHGKAIKDATLARIRDDSLSEGENFFLEQIANDIY